MRSCIQKGFYKILREGVDFFELQEHANGGTRAKKLVYVPSNKRKAIFKYDSGRKYRSGEDCSEKIASELAKKLGYPTADIDLAESATGKPGILSYIFVDKSKGETHEDMEFYLGVDKTNEATEYTIAKMENIIKSRFPDVDFNDFLRIIFFDALVGERDRHVGNWGITTKKGRRRISPLYDTANCLMLHFQDINFLRRRVLTQENGVQNYINSNRLAIYKDTNGDAYSPVISVIDYLLDNYPDFTKKEIKNLRKLKDDIIEGIVDRIPENRTNAERKYYIKNYLKTQRDNIIEKGEKYER